MDFAERVAQLSHARRLKVGAVVVKDDTVISYGYNGTPAGWDNNCEDTVVDSSGVERLVTKPEVLHSEMNALMKLARGGRPGVGAAMFLTHSPCIECAKGIYQAGITSVWYKNDYRNIEGQNFLRKCGVVVQKVGT